MEGCIVKAFIYIGACVTTIIYYNLSRFFLRI